MRFFFDVKSQGM